VAKFNLRENHMFALAIAMQTGAQEGDCPFKIKSKKHLEKLVQ